MDVEWKASLQATTLPEETITTTVSNKPIEDKGKRKSIESVEAEQSYKFKECPLVERLALEIDVKRQHCERRVE